MINALIDEFTPCLKDAYTGEIVQTEVIRIKRKSFLKKYNRRNGWYTNWEELTDENEIYALVVEGTVDIQGLIALAPQERTKAIYITWMCTNPQNNSLLTKDIKYYGVGGHLFAIAAKKSLDYGYDGYIYGFAANEHLLNHYAEKEGKKVIELTEIEKKRVITR